MAVVSLMLFVHRECSEIKKRCQDIEVDMIRSRP